MITLRICLRVGLVIAWAALNSFSVSNHYAKPGDFACVTSKRTAATAKQKGTSDAKKSGIKKSLPPATDVLESTLAFRGWMGENAVLRQEELLKDGGMRTSFFLLKPNRSRIQLRINWQSEGDNRDPAGLQEGRVLIADYVVKSEHPRISFQMDADPKQISALQESISSSDQPRAVLAVRAVLTIRMESRRGGPLILWKQSREITPAMGESGLVYRPPDLRSVILSPNESAILAELSVGGAIEYFVISMRPLRFR